jgi:hypothetical protein
LSIAIVLTILRVVLRTIIQRTRLTPSDMLLIASTVVAIGLFTTDVMSYNLGGMDDYDPEAPERPISEQIALMKVNFAGNYFYDTGIYFPKFALITFYYRLVPVTMPILRKFLYFVTGLTACFAVTTCMVDTFWCGRRVSVNWDLSGECSSYTSMEITQIDWSLNIFSDILSTYLYLFLFAPGDSRMGSSAILRQGPRSANTSRISQFSRFHFHFSLALRSIGSI